MRQQVFITGLSSAFMMSFLELFDPEKYEVTGISRKMPSKNSSCKWIQADLKEFLKDEKALKGYDILIHAAAITHCWTEEEYLDFNVKTTELLVERAKSSGVKQLVYVSTRAVGLDAGGYGKSKWLAEKYIQANFDNWLIFRPSEIFGGLKNEGIEKTLRDAIAKRVVVYPGGKSHLAPVALSDTVKLMYQEWAQKSKTQELITINGPESMSYADLIDRVARFKGKSILKLPIPKTVMYMIAWFLRIVKVDIGIVPDQVDRFYVSKGFEKRDYPMMSIDAYIKQLLKQPT